MLKCNGPLPCDETESSNMSTSNNTTSFVDSNETASVEPEISKLPTPEFVRPLPQGRWHTADQFFNLVTRPFAVQKDVLPGDKSNCYLFVDNTRNISVSLPTKKNKKTNATSMMIVVHGFQRRVDQSNQCLLKQTACCVTQKRKMRSTATKRERKKTNKMDTV